MMQILKIAVSVFAALLVLFFLTTMVSIFTPFSDEISMALSLPFSFLAGWTVWKSVHRNNMGLGLAVLSGALIFGGLGLSVGLLGPIIFASDANQGPLLGIFITGPLGCVVGAIIGYIYWSRHRQSGNGQNST